jgi:hypothetical protein
MNIDYSFGYMNLAPRKYKLNFSDVNKWDKDSRKVHEASIDIKWRKKYTLLKYLILDILSIYHTILCTNISTCMIDGTYLAICLHIKLWVW